VSITTADGSLERLVGLIRAEGGELASSVAPLARTPLFGPLAALGARTRAQADEYDLVLESVMEGYLVHFGSPRLLSTGDPDLRLLAGDFLYALGLVRLAGLGDLDAVADLGDLITLCAQAHAEGRTAPMADGGSLPAAVWALSVLAVTDGRWPEHGRAIREAREGAPEAAARGLSVAAERAEALSIGPELQRALIAFMKTGSHTPPST
jgi:hypothetical protein